MVSAIRPDALRARLAVADRPRPARSTLGVMRGARRVLAMFAVLCAFASSVAYVIPNAQAVEGGADSAAELTVADVQVAAPVSAGVAAATVTRDAYGVTLPPPPPPKVVAIPTSTGSRLFTSLVPSSSSAALQWPVAANTRISTGFGPRSCAGCSSYHLGADFNAASGTPIWAIADGVVVETNAPGYSALGTHVRLQHVIDGEVVTSVYAHMISGSMTLSVGDTVVAGQALGAMGCTGSCTGTHLHFEIHPGGGEAVDPVAWMNSKLGG